MPGERRRLIVCADDLGLHPSVNQAIRLAHRAGTVTSCSLIPGGRAFEDAVAVAAENPRLAVGIHLTLVEEKPLLPQAKLPSLVDSRGRFPSNYRRLLGALILGRIRLSEVEAELRHQIEHTLDAGIQPSHLDSLQHVHLFPGLLGIVERLATEYDIRNVRAGRVAESYWSPAVAALDLASRRAQRQLREHGLRTPDWVIGLRDRGRLNRESLERALAVVPPGVTELNCHPGTSRAELAKHYSWGYEWDSELAALLDPALPELLRERGIELMSYHDFRGP